MKLINQPFGRSRHQSKRRQKSPFINTTGRNRHQSNHRRQKTPSIKPQAEVAINRDKTHQPNTLAEVATCKPAQSAFFHLTYLNCEASVFVFVLFFFIIFLYYFLKIPNFFLDRPFGFSTHQEYIFVCP